MGTAQITSSSRKRPSRRASTGSAAPLAGAEAVSSEQELDRIEHDLDRQELAAMMGAVEADHRPVIRVAQVATAGQRPHRWALVRVAEPRLVMK